MSTKTAEYKRHADLVRARTKKITLAGQDIGALPPVKDAPRRAHAEEDFQFFCEAYFPSLFFLAWSKDHVRVLIKIEHAVKHGGQFAVAMPRGSGKTSLCHAAVMWAILTGRHKYVLLIAAASDGSENALANIKKHLTGNAELLGDFPEALYPIHRLEGESRKCMGQRYYGATTNIGWTAEQVILPTMPGSVCSGAIIRTAGLLGNIRGAMHVGEGGKANRPSLVIVDDPQTDQSARSASQSHERLTTINGAILNLSGPGKKIAAIMPCTVIRAGDMADRILDRKLHPQWQGERTKMVYSFPTNEKLWEQYATLRADSFRADGSGSEATEFYGANRDAMDAGSVAAWPQRFNPDELSAIQHAMNLKLRDEYAFFAEYQNEPKSDAVGVVDMPTADEIAAKLSGIDRGVAPIGASHLTAFIDVQKTVLFYTVAAWADDFTGWVIDYGVYPQQGVDYLALRDVKATLESVKPNAGPGGAIHAGLEALTGKLLGGEWGRDDGARMKVERCLIDAGWGESTDLVYNFCRSSPHAAVLTPSHGWGIGAAKRPMHQWSKKPGERAGHNWRMPVMADKRVVRHVIFDANYWKTFIMAALATPIGDKGCLSLYGLKASRHRMFADHLTAEYPVRTSGYGRSVDEWKLRVEKPDNHLLDCCVGAAVAASMQGVKREGSNQHDTASATPRVRVKASDLQKKKRGY